MFVTTKWSEERKAAMLRDMWNLKKEMMTKEAFRVLSGKYDSTIGCVKQMYYKVRFDPKTVQDAQSLQAKLTGTEPAEVNNPAPAAPTEDGLMDSTVRLLEGLQSLGSVNTKAFLDGLSEIVTRAVAGVDQSEVDDLRRQVAVEAGAIRRLTESLTVSRDENTRQAQEIEFLRNALSRTQDDLDERNAALESIDRMNRQFHRMGSIEKMKGIDQFTWSIRVACGNEVAS